MSEDPERDEGDEESPDSPPSESDSSADSPADSSAEGTDDAPAEESTTDESANDAEGDEPSEEPQESDEAESDDGDGKEESDDAEGEDAEGDEVDGDNAEGDEVDDDNAEGDEVDDDVDTEGDDTEGDADAEGENGASDDPEDDDDADGGDADESDTTDSEPDAGAEPVPEPNLTGEESEATDDEDADDEPPDDAGEETYIEEFTVPEMGTDADVDDKDDEERDADIPDEDEVDDEVDEGVDTAENSDRTLPEDEDGVGVDVPQQTLDNEDDGDDLWGEGPESDQEMPLADHIEEMMRRLSVVFLVAGTVALTLLGLGEAFEPLPTAVELIDALWNNAIPGAPEMADRRPRLYGPLELILTKLKVTALAGLLIGLPVFVYETYLFMRPGLYRHERRYYLAAVPTSLILGTIGMSFAHFVIIPAIMDYFTVYTQENVASVAYGLAETFNLILILMGYMAVVFQIPLFIMLAIMMGLTTRLWLEDKRLLFWGGFLTVAFIVNPDPTGMTPFIIAATMIVLYEGTLALLRWTGN